MALNLIIFSRLFIDNLLIDSNHSAFESKIKVFFLGSSASPKMAKQPIKEYLLNGFLEPTNEPYALAKILGIKLCDHTAG